MRKGMLLLFSTCFFVTTSFADDLRWISKVNAQRAADFFKQIKEVTLYCGCCDGDVAQEVEVLGAEVKFTGHQQFYEVYVTYDYRGETKTVAVDLAYVWVKTAEGFKTVGEVLEIEHYPCDPPNE